jgi:TPR repeat protein
MDEEDPRFREAIAAIEAGEFDRSFEIVYELAEGGEPLARHFLGWHYHKGIGVTQDDQQAVKWWQMAARDGVAESQQGLGWAYEHGRGVDRNYVEAYRWYSRAVNSGDQEARQNLRELSAKLSAEQIKQIEDVAG